MSVRSQTWLREIYGIQLCNVTWIIANIHEMSANFCSHATDDMLMLNDLVIIKPFTLWSHDNSFRHIYSHLSYSNILNCVILKLPPVAQNVQMQKKKYTKLSECNVLLMVSMEYISHRKYFNGFAVAFSLLYANYMLSNINYCRLTSINNHPLIDKIMYWKISERKNHFVWKCWLLKKISKKNDEIFWVNAYLVFYDSTFKPN